TMQLLFEEIEVLQELYGNNKIDFMNLANKTRTFLTIIDECRRVAVNNTDDIEAGYFSFPILYTINEKKEDGKIIL
ncbi:hypothetical protein ILUMI_18673, partial [Ignelater luminosus]